ncbi:caspase domain-containing protein, partial [Kibdelosporangium lantanae]
MRRYLITAGTSVYANTFALPSVPQDLADVGTTLESLGYSLAFTLTDPRTDELRAALDTWVGSDVRGDDALILYYTGHGERDSTRHYLLCADTVPGRLAGTALATEDVVRILTSEGVRRLLLIVDTCYSGQGTVDALSLLNLRTDYDGLLAFAVIAAARGRETAEEGAFAQAFKDVLASPDLAGQRQRHLYLKQVVDGVNEELRRRNIPQHATYGVLLDEGGFDFIPNPRYQEDLPSDGVDLAVQRTWVSVEGR